MDERQASVDFLKQEAAFVFEFFQTAEHEARATERWVLIALGAIYSYLATQKIPSGLSVVAWYVPTFVAVAASVRAVGLGWRQYHLLRYLKKVERQVALPSQVPGWALSYTKAPPFIAISAVIFYAFLIVGTFAIAIVGTLVIVLELT